MDETKLPVDAQVRGVNFILCILLSRLSKFLSPFQALCHV